MKIVIGSDHAAVDERKAVAASLRDAGHDVEDLGYDGDGSADYPDFAAKVARAVAAGEAERGLLLCGSGIGVAIAASKVAGVRAATITDEWMAEMCRRHNNANVACFGARRTAVPAIVAMTEVFLRTDFDGGRHTGRVAKIDALDHEGASFPS